MIGFPSYPDGEPLCSAPGTPESVRDLHPALGLPDAAAAFLGVAGDRRDLRVPARDLRVLGGVVSVGGERLRLRARSVKQLHHRVELALGRRVAVGDDLRRGLALLGDRIVLVRVEGDEVRAVVGEYFTPMDDADVLARLARAATAMGWSRDLGVRLIASSDTTTNVRATVGRSRVDVRPDDPFEIGIDIGNSEVGAGALTLRTLTWRSRCWNYSLGPVGARLAHVGGAHRLERDWRLVLAHAVHQGQGLLDAWRASSTFDAANDVSEAAKVRTLAGRLARERWAQHIVEGAR